MAAPAISAELPALPRGALVDAMTAEQFGSIKIFAKVAKRLGDFPNSFRLRRFRPGETICQQGEHGNTAFYLLNREDIQGLGGTAPTAWPEDDRVDVATVEIFSASQSVTAPKTGWWSKLWGKGAAVAQRARPASIASEGPQNVDLQTGKGQIFTGDFVGEGSCTSNRPRAATVTVHRECYGIEMLRHLFLSLLKDKAFQAEMDLIYRSRVLSSQLGQFTLFHELTEDQLHALSQRVEFFRVDPGNVIIDQHDTPDAVYIVRSGLVQIIRGNFYLTADELRPTVAKLGKQLTAALGAKPDVDAATRSQEATRKLAELLGENLLSQLSDPVAEEYVEAAAQALRAICKSGELLTAKECAPLLERATFRSAVRTFSGFEEDKKINLKKFSPLEVRIASRVLLAEILPDVIPLAPPADARQIVSYLSQGEIFGEMGITSGSPRNSTCIAFDHPDEAHKTGLVELLKIDVATLEHLWSIAPNVKTQMQQQTELRAAQNQAPIQDKPVVFSDRFEQLGLYQGQKLMVIDLDRCTRCGECVQACIDTHDDGQTRLYLDGPRIDRYLIPTTCRNCRDPVCMIGCPVGSIQRGDIGQIVIRDWCVGCGICARQCPYDSIQMNDVGLIAERGSLWRFASSQTAGARWQTSRFRDSRWQQTMSPIDWNLDLAARLGADATGEICLRHAFDVSPTHAAAQGYELSLTTEVAESVDDITVTIDGTPLDLTAPKRAGQAFKATIAADQLSVGRHVTTVTLPRPANEIPRLLMHVHLCVLTGTMLDQYQAHASVCDQCSTTSFGPACVYACPHEAAIRYDGRTGLPS